MLKEEANNAHQDTHSFGYKMSLQEIRPLGATLLALTKSRR
jgi:hypothetical protein